MALTKPPGIPSPAVSDLLSPIIPALTAAAVSSEPAPAVLPLLSPILRQRVQFLASSGPDPWLRLLCYDSSKAAKLADVATNGSLIPHPVSGEIEVDWDHDCETRFRRVDPETIQAFAVLAELGLAFRLVYCVGDKEGGGDGWRIGEVTVAEQPDPFTDFEGASRNLAAAEESFEQQAAQQKKVSLQLNPNSTSTANGHLTTTNAGAGRADDHGDDDNDDDDDYWARYDNTPARTPAQAQSPAPRGPGGPVGGYNDGGNSNPEMPHSADDAYYARYSDVQPAMDNHDPDEEADQAHLMPPSLGLDRLASQNSNHTHTTTTVEASAPAANGASRDRASPDPAHEGLVHPRPESSASSRSSQVVEKLEAQAGRKDQSDFGVKQHISRSLRSLFMLSRAAGIERDEFEQLVRDELDVLGMVEED